MLSPDRMPARFRVRMEFEDWVDKQPRDKKYPWANRTECACAQFIRHAYGYTPPASLRERVKRFFVGFERAEHPDEGLVWEQFNEIARVQPHTFGALSDRLHQIS